MLKILDYPFNEMKQIHKLLFRASTHGWKSTDFHSHCDNKGPSLVIIKTAKDYVFGGYTSVSWDSSIKWK